MSENKSKQRKTSKNSKRTSKRPEPSARRAMLRYLARNKGAHSIATLGQQIFMRAPFKRDRRHARWHVRTSAKTLLRAKLIKRAKVPGRGGRVIGYEVTPLGRNA